MRKRGFTLVEQMITVAIIGISSAILAGTARYSLLTGFGELQRERALLLLEYHAGCASTGSPVDDATVQRLVEFLPDTRVTATSTGDLTTVTVQWRPPLGLSQQHSLTVFTSGDSP